MPAGLPILRLGWYRPVHAKLVASQDTRAVLVGRKLLQGKLTDVELSIWGILRGYGLKVGDVSRGRFEARIEELIVGHATLETVIGAQTWRRASSHVDGCHRLLQGATAMAAWRNKC